MSRMNPPIISFYEKFLEWRVRANKRKAERCLVKNEKYTKKAELYAKKLEEEKAKRNK